MAGPESANVDIFACNDQDTNTVQIDDPTGAQAWSSLSLVLCLEASAPDYTREMIQPLDLERALGRLREYVHV